MKKLSLVLFSILMIFSMCTNIFATDAVGDGESGGSGQTQNYQGVTTPVGEGTQQLTVGVRISFVNNYGKDILVKDYILQKTNEYEADEKAFFVDNHSKAYYSNYSYKPFDNRTTKRGSNILSLSPSTFEGYFSSNGFNVPFSDGDFVYDLTGGDKHSYRISNAAEWFDKKNYKGSDYESSLRNLLTLLVGKEYVDDVDKLKNLFMIIEPTTMVRVKKDPNCSTNCAQDYYYGTAYEIAYITSKYSDNNNTGKYAGTGLWGIATLTNNMVCSGHLTGKINNAIDLKNLSISGFSGQNYFNNIKTANLASYCVPNSEGKIRISKDILTNTNNGLGMTVVWFYDKLTFDLTCEKVHEIAGAPKYDESNLISCSSYKFIVDDYMAKKSSSDKSISYSWYKMNCGCKDTAGNIDCTPKTDVNVCTDSSTISVEYSDSDDWNNCIFDDKGYYSIDVHKTSADGALTYYEENLGNRYCSVYCTENLTAIFDKSVGEVKAGTNFVWPKTANVNGSRTCKTKEIRWAEYLNDVKKANLEVKAAYGAYMMGVKKNEAIDRQTYTANSSRCNCINNVGTSCCASGHNESYDCSYTISNWNASTGQYEQVKVSSTCRKWVCDQADNTKYGYYSTENYSVNLGMPSELGNYRDSDSIGGCSDSYTPNRADENQLYNAYLRAKQNAAAIAKMIEDCYTWSDDKVYNIADTNLKISYNDATYIYNELLDKTVDYESDDDDDCVSYNTKVLVCDGTRCNYNTVPVKKCGFYSKIVSADQNFALKDGTFQYVLKGSGNLSNFSIHANQLSNYRNISYVDIGYANLPVSYKMRDAQYNISLAYNKFGHDSDIGFKTDVDTILGSISPNYGDWKCNYTVVSKLIPEETIHAGIDVIYRTIDLRNPFPSIDGDGRQVGPNWCYEENCNNDNYMIKNVITDYEMPDEPMYSFILTPSVIQQIRKYNKENSYDDFKLTCESNTGKACVSDFLTSLKDGSLNNSSFDAKATGKCINLNFSRVSDSNYFYSECKEDFYY